MATQATPDVIVLGMTLKDIFTLVMVPIIAALTTVIVQDFLQRRERRTQILRMLLATRAYPGDPAYTAAINVIPVEFNGAKAVTDAWSSYIQHVSGSQIPGDEERFQKRSMVLQTKLISAMMKSLGLKHSEADIQADGYVATGYARRDMLYLDSLKATREIADTLRAQGPGSGSGFA